MFIFYQLRYTQNRQVNKPIIAFIKQIDKSGIHYEYRRNH